MTLSMRSIKLPTINVTFTLMNKMKVLLMHLACIGSDRYLCGDGRGEGVSEFSPILGGEFDFYERGGVRILFQMYRKTNKCVILRKRGTSRLVPGLE